MINKDIKNYSLKYFYLNLKLWLIFSPIIFLSLVYDLIDKFIEFPNWIETFLLFTLYCSIAITFIKTIWIYRYLWPKKEQ